MCTVPFAPAKHKSWLERPAKGGKKGFATIPNKVWRRRRRWWLAAWCVGTKRRGGSKAMHAVRYTEERKEKGKKKSRKEGRDRSVEAIGEEERKAFLFGCLASHLRGK